MSKLMDEKSIPALLKEMTVEEKVELLIGNSSFKTKEMPQYGIPSILYLDGATGVNLMQYLGELMNMFSPSEDKEQEESDDSSNESGAAFLNMIVYATNHRELPDTMSDEEKAMIEGVRTMVDSIRPEGEEPNCFPPGMLLGATWKPELIYNIGEAVARETQAYGVDVLLGTPNTNIHRDPKNGRLFESFSEDPYLSSKMAPQFVRGVQDQDMPADVKHFAANNQETMRQGINEIIYERALREIYLPGFEACVKEAGVDTVMSAYNSINGTPCAQNARLLTDILKDEWGFEGQVVSDWGAVYDQVEALKAGNDMDMPGPRGKKRILEAIANGDLKMERLDDAVTRTLKMILKTPAFRGRKYTKIDNEVSKNAAYHAAAEGITLLKNNGTLPLQKTCKVALYGKHTERFMESGTGSAQVDTGKYTNLLDEMKKKVENVTYGDSMEKADVVIVSVGASGQEGKDRPDMDLDADDKAMLMNVVKEAKQAKKKIVVLLNIAGPVDMTEYIDDVDAVVCLFFPGGEGARACTDILFGDVNPSGKLPLTFPKHYKDCPTSINFPGQFGTVLYGEGLYVGYRYYDYKEIEPLYAFGYGLSYTTFSIRDIQLSQKEYPYEGEKPLVVSVKVKNTGSVKGKEVVQIYVSDEKSTLLKPQKELKGFAKVELEPGEEKTVEISLDQRAFAAYDVTLHDWTVEPGEFTILAGNASNNISCSTKVIVTGKNLYGYSLRCECGKLAESEAALNVCAEMLGEGFNIKGFKTNALYFSGAPVGSVVEPIAKAVSGGNDEYKDQLLKKLDDALCNIPVEE